MAEQKARELGPEESELLLRIEQDPSALDDVVEDLSARNRRKRQLAACMLGLVAQRNAGLLAGCIPEMIDALELPEAQTRWEILDALTLLVPEHAKELGSAYEGAADALFDEVSATLRLSAFRFLTAWGATERGRSKKVWPVVDEAIQCFHGDLEYRDMLVCLHEFAGGKIEGGVAGELAGRLRFDAESGKGVFIKGRSAEIYEMLVARFKLDKPQKRARAVAKSESEDDE